MRLFKFKYLKLLFVVSALIGLAAAYNSSEKVTMTVEAVTSATLPSKAPQQTSGNPVAAAGGSAATTKATSQSAPVCHPGSYTKPSAPQAVATQPGLHQTIQAPSFYTVYGNSAYEINRQMAACSPAGEGGETYAASTDYSLNWAFDYSGGDDGLCRVTAVSVAINIGVVYPAWQPTSGAATGTNASWQKFITSLTAHENGHVQINQAGAARLLADLQNLPATDCNNIVTAAAYTANADIQAINQANENYDAATNHGETQGAVLN